MRKADKVIKNHEFDFENVVDNTDPNTTVMTMMEKSK
jgi:hypothetical protein